MTKAVDAFRTISEVADDLGIPKHVLRFWEAKFAQIRPMKRGGGRRYYRPEDLELLRGIRQLLHRDGYTIKGVQKILREQGIDAVKLRILASEGSPATPAVAAAAEAARPAGRRPPARAGKPAASRAATPAMRRAQVIAAAIAELERCRALLGGSPAAPEARATAQRQAP